MPVPFGFHPALNDFLLIQKIVDEGFLDTTLSFFSA